MDLSDVVWRKSSRSAGNNECVEVAVSPAGTSFRDSKAPSAGVLTFGGRGYQRFLAGVKLGVLDH